jgi:hypothetical protein
VWISRGSVRVNATSRMECSKVVIPVDITLAASRGCCAAADVTLEPAQGASAKSGGTGASGWGARAERSMAMAA